MPGIGARPSADASGRSSGSAAGCEVLLTLSLSLRPALAQLDSQIQEAEAECAAYEARLRPAACASKPLESAPLFVDLTPGPLFSSPVRSPFCPAQEALERLTAEAAEGAAECPSREAFAAEMASLLAAEAAELAAADSASSALRDAEGELARLTAAAEGMEAMEARFWHDYSDFQLQLLRYGEDRDALLARIAHAGEQREELRKTNVFNDAFHIWHDGPFGTINGLRLGRTGGACAPNGTPCRAP